MGLIKLAIIGGAGVWAVKKISNARADREGCHHRCNKHHNDHNDQYPPQYQQQPRQQPQDRFDEKEKSTRHMDSYESQYPPATPIQQLQAPPLQFTDLRSPEQQERDANRPMHLSNNQYYTSTPQRGYPEYPPVDGPPRYQPQYRQQKSGFVESEEVLSRSDAHSTASRRGGNLRDDGMAFLDSMADKAKNIRTDMKGKSPKEYLQNVLDK